MGGSPDGRGVVAAANYAARRFGIHSAMPASTARRLCPHAIFLRQRMNHYAHVSRQIGEIFHRFTSLVEPLSLDEAFLDVAGSEQLFGSPSEIGRQIKSAIRDELNLVASVGIAPNKFVAKIASDLEKPDGFVVVEEEGVQRFLDALPVGRLWGVGKSTSRVFERLGIERIEQIRRLSVEVLQSHFGSYGKHLWRLALGLDDRPVLPDHAAKSISHETTFTVDVEGMDVLRSWLRELTEQVARRLRRQQLSCRTVHIKVRYSDFHTITRSSTFGDPSDITDEIWRPAVEMLTTRLPDRKLLIRLLGVGVSGIEAAQKTQQSLFTDQKRDKQSRLDAVTDEIATRFGRSAVSRGSGLQTEPNRQPTEGKLRNLD